MQAITKVFSDIVKPYIDATDNGLINNDYTNGAVNFLPNTASPATVNGITFTVNSDGSVTANGTATARVSKTIHAFAQDEYVNSISKLYLSGCPSNGSNNTYMLYATIKKRSDNSYVAERQDIGSGRLIEYDNVNNFIESVSILIAAGQTVSNLTFKPMITVADMPNSDYAHYVPYAMSNQELTSENQTLSTKMTDNINNNGAKNLLPMDLETIKSLNTAGTWSGNTYTYRGLNYTIATDSSGNITQIVANGTPSDYNSLLFLAPLKYYDSDIKANGTPANGSFETFGMQVVKDSLDSAYIGIYNNNDYAAGVGNYSMRIRIAAGYTANNLVFKPMIRLASDPDATFVPYAMTNQELTNSVIIISNDNVFTDANTHINAIRSGNVVTVNFDDSLSITASADTTICTLPQKFRPSLSKISFRDPLNNLRIVIDLDGNITCKTELSSGQVRGYATYVTRQPM